jgi:hypothetical protein
MEQTASAKRGEANGGAAESHEKTTTGATFSDCKLPNTRRIHQASLKVIGQEVWWLCTRSSFRKLCETLADTSMHEEVMSCTKIAQRSHWAVRVANENPDESGAFLRSPNRVC